MNILNRSFAIFVVGLFRITRILALLLLIPAWSASADSGILNQLAAELSDKHDARRPQLFWDLRASETPAMRVIQEAPGIDLMYLDGRGHPIYYAVKNQTACETVTAHLLWPGGYSGFNLDGGGHSQGEVGIWDFGAVRATQQEFGSRVSWADTAAYAPVDHATLVGGTMAASGVVAQAKGVAPGTLLDSYDWNNDLVEMASAAAGGMLVSNHSYGGALGWSMVPGDTLWRWFGDATVSGPEDYYFGFYDSLTMDLDQIAYDAPYYTIVRAAGNDRGEGPASDTLHWHWDANTTSWVQSSDHHDVDGGASGFDCMDFFATGKNVITVGSCNDIPWGGQATPTLSPFSAYGPTDDGRVKPDFVANGEALFSPVAFTDTLYTFATGTSMAAPSVSASIALVVEYFENALGYTPLASTVKALFMESAHDEGNLGPDYTWGWGRLNALTAVYMIQGDSTEANGRIHEDTLANGESRTWYVQRPSGYDLSVALAWTDPAGSPPASGLDPNAPMLINDLDVRLESLDGDTIMAPFVLDPANPANPATLGDNVIDNAEKIHVQSFPNLGYYWKVTVTHKGTLASPQAFSIVSSRPLYQTHIFSEVASDDLLDSIDTRLATFVDIDGDGDEDIYASLSASPLARLLRNDAGSFFEIGAGVLANAGDPAVWADYDADGDLDLYAGPTNVKGLYRNDNGTFVTLTTGPYSGFFDNSPRSAAFADYDLDGDLDLYVVHAFDASKLWRNDGAAGWIDATSGPLTTFFNWDSRTFWYDYDFDNDPDLFVEGGTARIYRNDGAGAFSDGGTYQGGGNNSAWADYDNDGDLDAYNLGANTGPNFLRRNDDGVFVDASTQAGLWDDDPDYSWGATWADWNNDGWLDLFVVSATTDLERLYMSLGDGRFQNVSIPDHFLDDDIRGCVASDVDADGDLDMLLYAYGKNRLFRNDDPATNNWLRVDPVASGTANKSASTGAPVTGAVVEMEVGGVTQTRWLGRGGNANELVAFFGLGEASVVDRIEVKWPDGTDAAIYTNVAANQILTIDKNAVTTGVDDPDVVPQSAALHQNSPNPFNPTTTIRYQVASSAPVALRVYDIAGRVVRTLVAEQAHEPGVFEVRWDGQSDARLPVASGAYFYRLETARSVETRKMILVK